MIWILVVSQFLMGFPTNANIEQNHCHLIEEYKHFKTAMDEYKQFQITMDTYLASSDGICKGVFYNYTDCASILKEYPKAEDGVYRIKPSDEQGSFKTYCDMTQHGGGWLVIQRRVDGLEDFYRTWFEYMDGFGNLTGEFWLGNEKIHRLTRQTTYELRVDLTFLDGKTAYGHYNNFRLANMSNFYRLAVSGFSGNAGDSLAGHNGMRFTAKNLDLDTHKTKNCAVSYHGAWWYKACYNTNLNGIYNDTTSKGIRWASKHTQHTSMKIRPLHRNKEE
ncbi:fibrinogen C domain-containing protein 1-like [Haliotis rufescens]|uniref:fibrinogen C domain-containing protein 1-like n=1 Tax=Haliotis rufescens TaxID=6454 RepID=UPI00201F85ED|nr:fibrinogen C domain-containing protein 1-like [Haliotis rufescens]